MKAGDGGNGSISLRRAAFEEFGGPDGGDGGNGGHILLQGKSRPLGINLALLISTLLLFDGRKTSFNLMVA